MDVSEKEILDQFEDWEIHSRALVKVSDTILVACFPPFLTPLKCVEKPSRWALHILRPLPHYADGRVVLLGDAVSSISVYDRWSGG